MNIAILHVTDHYRGDHAADVAIAVHPIAGETVEALVARLDLKPTDRIELRIMQPLSESSPVER